MFAPFAVRDVSMGNVSTSLCFDLFVRDTVVHSQHGDNHRRFVSQDSYFFGGGRWVTKIIYATQTDYNAHNVYSELDRLEYENIRQKDIHIADPSHGTPAFIFAARHILRTNIVSRKFRLPSSS